MQALQFNTRLIKAPGYDYIQVPGDLLDNPRDSVWVRLIINSVASTARTTPLLDGTHRVYFNRESMFNLGLKAAQSLSVSIQRLEQPPALNDLSADFLGALAGLAIEEDFKRLPFETQRKYFEKVEKTPFGNRADAIREVTAEILSIKDGLPRGDSL